MIDKFNTITRMDFIWQSNNSEFSQTNTVATVPASLLQIRYALPNHVNSLCMGIINNYFFSLFFIMLQDQWIVSHLSFQQYWAREGTSWLWCSSPWLDKHHNVLPIYKSCHVQKVQKISPGICLMFCSLLCVQWYHHTNWNLSLVLHPVYICLNFPSCELCLSMSSDHSKHYVFFIEFIWFLMWTQEIRFGQFCISGT